MEIKTDSVQVAKVAVALHFAQTYTSTYDEKEDKFVNLLARFADAYDVVNAVVEAELSTDEINSIITRIAEELKVDPPPRQ